METSRNLRAAVTGILERGRKVLLTCWPGNRPPEPIADETRRGPKRAAEDGGVFQH